MCSTVGGYLEYRGGYHDKCGDILSTVGDDMMQVGDIMNTVGGTVPWRDTILCNLTTRYAFS